MTQLEKQFQARIAQAKEAARLASIAAAARAEYASNTKSRTSMSAVSGTLLNPPPIPHASNNFFPASEPLAIPLDVKNRIDRLVEFVARNGDAFEATAKQREENNPDFAFLKPGGPYSDYYLAKKRQLCEAQPVLAHLPLARTPVASSFVPPLVSTDLLGISVGAMANVCKFARASGVAAYAPIPREIILNFARLPPVEPARLEVRLLEFYRDDYVSS